MHNVEPDMTREGGSIPVTLTFEEATGKNVMLLPMGCADDGAHSQNEKLNRSNFLLGVIDSLIFHHPALTPSLGKIQLRSYE